ncbi:MAG: SRPBCC domain-containing protein [Proteobacteria bacterium]|nr:SRPBCC domain-containing protein [Pseudomonadota bacterium]
MLLEAQLTLEADRLSIKQIFAAPIDQLFACFTQAELLCQWHAPGEMQTTAEVDLKVGGHYRIAMKDAEGQVFTAIGE